MLFGDLTLYLAAIAVSYLFFVFFCGTLNPFVKPRKYLSDYRRIRYFRYVAGALLFCSILSLLAFQKLFIALPVAAIAGSILFTLLILYPSWRYFRKKYTKTPEPANTVEPQPPVFEIRQPTSSKIKKSLAIGRPITAQQTFMADTPTELPAYSSPDTPTELLTFSSPDDLNELLTNSSSDEYALEMDIKRATAHIDDNLIDMDQSIAEAEFETLLATEEQMNEAAIPDFMDIAPDNNANGKQEPDLEHDRLFLTDDFGYSTTPHHISTLENDSQENDSQATKIAALERKNASLSNTHELLEGQIAKLELGMRHKDATVRKSIAQKEQALQIKDEALAMAAMERKKRKLTEVKAQKIVMQLKQNLKQLEHDRQA